MISVTSGLSLKLYLNSLVYRQNIFGSSSKVLGNLRKSSDIFRNFWNSRKMFGNVPLVFGTILENLQKSLENHRKRRCQYVYVTSLNVFSGRYSLLSNQYIGMSKQQRGYLFYTNAVTPLKTSQQACTWLVTTLDLHHSCINTRPLP